MDRRRVSAVPTPVVVAAALSILCRMLTGMPADLRWRRGLVGPAEVVVTVPPGRYPVRVAAIRAEPLDVDDPEPLRLGTAAKLTVREEPVVAWEVALRPRGGPRAAAAGPDLHLRR
jgi:hypothetical protein